jgi:hypothetical protein
MSTQPTPKSLMAMIEFFVGYLERAIHEERQLRPLSTLREERLAAVRSGYDAKTHFNIIDTIRSQLNFARTRLENKVSPSEYVATLWQKKFNGAISETIYEIISDIWQKTRQNQPIA